MAVTTQAEADAYAQQRYTAALQTYRNALGDTDAEGGSLVSFQDRPRLDTYQAQANTMLSSYQTAEATKAQNAASYDALVTEYETSQSTDNPMSMIDFLERKDAIGTVPSATAGATSTSTSGGQVPISSKTPTSAADSAVPNNLGIQTQEQQVSTRDALTGNITDPNVPAAGIQTYTELGKNDNEIIDVAGAQVGDSAPIGTATTGPARLATYWGVGDATTMDATQVNAQTPEAQAATSAVSKLVDEKTGALTNEATAAQGLLDPSALVDAATSTVSADGKAVAQTADLETKATMVGQLNGLLAELEAGNVPAWARPAVDNVNAEMARRGISRSNIGRDALFNAIIQAALPIAQNDAQAEAQRGSQNLTNRQQTALFNAQNVMQMDMANLSNEQQARLMNSQAIQTMTLANLNNRQQAAMTNAANWAAMDTANLSAAMTAQVENARNFLQMDMSNLSNEQQANLVNQQSKLQTLMGDQAADNAAKQFNAASQTQVDQFMVQIGANVSQFNAQQVNALKTYNADKINATNQFNEAMSFQRDQFDAQMYAQIEQSNVTWRRQMNQIDTAGLNAVNQANAINAFNLSNQALTLAWQDLRDSASWAFQAGENDQEKDLRLAIAALGNESDKAALSSAAWSAVGGLVARMI